jgi:hypothetical protein
MGKVVEKLPKGNIVYVVDNKDNLVVVGLPHDKNGNPTGEPKVAVVPPTENKKNPNPMAEDYRGQIDAEWMRRFNAKLKGAVDPHDEFGQPDVDIDKFIAGTIAASMSKVNPNPDAGPIDTSGGGRLPGDDLIIPEFKVHVPKTGKGPKPQIGPGGPAPRGLGGDSPLKAAALRGTALLSSSQSTMLNNQNDDTTGSPASSSSRANSSR